MEEFAQQAREVLGLHLSPSQLNCLEIYERELQYWNNTHNLTAVHDSDQIRVKHFLDSLTCSIVMGDSKSDSLVDVGTGAGFPGLPLKILNPSLHLTLIESVGKKAEFCRHIAHSLGFQDVEVLHDRVEKIGQQPDHRQKYDWAVARAVAVLPALVEYLLPLLKIGGTMVALKGESALIEAHDSEHALTILGGHLRKLVPITLPKVVEQRYLVVIDKVATTPNVYPRRIGIPTKRPLKKSYKSI